MMLRWGRYVESNMKMISLSERSYLPKVLPARSQVRKQEIDGVESRSTGRTFSKPMRSVQTESGPCHARSGFWV